MEGVLESSQSVTQSNGCRQTRKESALKIQTQFPGILIAANTSVLAIGLHSTPCLGILTSSGCVILTTQISPNFMPSIPRDLTCIGLMISPTQQFTKLLKSERGHSVCGGLDP